MLKRKLYLIIKRLWINIKPKIKQMLEPPEEQTQAVQANSRTIEYPFIIKNIAGLQKGRVHDVGYAGSNLPTELASLGFQVYGIDARKYFLKYPRVFFCSRRRS